MISRSALEKYFVDEEGRPIKPLALTYLNVPSQIAIDGGSLVWDLYKVVEDERWSNVAPTEKTLPEFPAVFR